MGHASRIDKWTWSSHASYASSSTTQLPTTSPTTSITMVFSTLTDALTKPHAVLESLYEEFKGTQDGSQEGFPSLVAKHFQSVFDDNDKLSQVCLSINTSIPLRNKHLAHVDQPFDPLESQHVLQIPNSRPLSRDGSGYVSVSRGLSRLTQWPSVRMGTGRLTRYRRWWTKSSWWIYLQRVGRTELVGTKCCVGD